MQNAAVDALESSQCSNSSCINILVRFLVGQQYSVRPAVQHEELPKRALQYCKALQGCLYAGREARAAGGASVMLTVTAQL